MTRSFQILALGALVMASIVIYFVSQFASISTVEAEAPTAAATLQSTIVDSAPASMPTVQIGDKTVVVAINESGVETRIEDPRFYSGNEVLNVLLTTPSYRTILFLSISDGVWLIIPIETFRQADKIGDVDIVTLANGQQLRGKLVGAMPSSIGDAVVDLSSVKRLVLITLSPPTKTPTPTAQPNLLAQLQVQKPEGSVYTVSNPYFIFGFFSTVGFARGGRNMYEATIKFHINFNNEDITAGLSDFEEISFNNDEVTAKAKNGTEITGRFILKANEAPYEERNSEYFLVADLVDSGIGIAVKDPVAILRRVSR